MNEFIWSMSSRVRSSWEKSMSVPSCCGAQSCGQQWLHGGADRVEAGPDGLAGGEAVVDPLEDRGELEVGQAQVELQGVVEQVRVEPPRVGVLRDDRVRGGVARRAADVTDPERGGQGAEAVVDEQ